VGLSPLKRGSKEKKTSKAAGPTWRGCANRRKKGAGGSNKKGGKGRKAVAGRTLCKEGIAFLTTRRRERKKTLITTSAEGGKIRGHKLLRQLMSSLAKGEKKQGKNLLIPRKAR